MRAATPGLLVMYDGITVSNLPEGGQAYVGYIDGNWPNLVGVRARFPGLPLLVLTTGLGPADGVDVEPGNSAWDNGCAAVPVWVKERIAAGVHRPVIYISSAYSQMIIDKLAAAGIPRSQFRLFSAHWNNVNHVCHPSVCGQPVADGTQWKGNVNNAYDISLVQSDFFTGPPPPPKPKPKPVVVVQEDFMKVVIGTGVPSAKDPNPVFVLWGGTKRWLSNQALVKDWLTLAGQAAYEPCPWAVISVIPDAPGSFPVPL